MTGLKTFLARLWPKGLMGQTVLLVLIALFSAQIISALIIRSEARDFYRGAEVRFLADRVAPLAALMKNTQPASTETMETTSVCSLPATSGTISPSTAETMYSCAKPLRSESHKNCSPPSSQCIGCTSKAIRATAGTIGPTS